ncbi:MAG: hypothetical protein A3G02_02380 [Candidatus Yanofskybacteria bacterium RIFCSPLOWO2_12_FULL_44_13b]|uniref:Uncharacterized protein n=2 Tax=Candidatus Yanofskyibacteriota TaxID=1752733 RepID=A0A1F8H349_9BACT|nr:MAG: hypothetical protein A2657_01935 [Candidatus Yanofskybacteria bacterium RIFCSPHIGHO2_01_FULL_44_110b]OGN18511.1 MAG: hypothetical protein A3F50_02070 [Candidatus Yanofskybacteria bacterium RIFCSPHIGHO2_12_FULL_44_29b]OGN26463.1 MAG: hypothetical protein A3B12_02955 [Candidatus Yanofskybacteria bacterium RIFCSPLOWO2_01_FULL_44_88]OGN31408.1 MAG: hypothetical protein A3I96_01060 [Candidatus Yanofskybacteria bacterium RIFCSPLOWO2_02_FULL_44_18]OGN34597.1 MAG: hypothetical protein A3G02_023
MAMTSPEVAPLAIKCVVKDVLELAGEFESKLEPVKLAKLRIVHGSLVDEAAKVAAEIQRRELLLKEVE